MANIKQYDSPVDGLRPTEVGVDAAVQTARRSGAFFNQMANSTKEVGDQIASNVSSDIRTAGTLAMDYMAHREIGHGAAAFAGLNDKLTQSWNETVKTANPDDPNVANKFRQDVLEPALENFGGQFFTEKAQNWAMGQVNSLRNHMFEKTAADMSSLAADTVSLHMKQTANSLSNTAVNDPSSVPQLLNSVDSTVGPLVDSSPYLKGAVGQKAKINLTQDMKQRIVQSGAMSAIQKSSNPEATAAEWSRKYPEYINGQETLSLAKAARTQIKFNQSIDRQNRLAVKQEQALAADHFVAEKVASVIKPDGTVDTTQKPALLKALHDAALPGNVDANGKSTYQPGLTASKALELFNFANREDVVKSSNPVVKNMLQDKLYSGDLDPIAIAKAANDGELSHSDAGILMGQYRDIQEHPFHDKTFEAAMRGADAMLVVPTASSDFKQEFFAAYRKLDPAARASALNFKDPKSLISQMIETHQPSMADKIQYKTLQGIGQGIVDPAKALPVLTAPQLPPGMTRKDAIEKYGPGAWVKNSRGDLVQLPKE